MTRWFLAAWRWLDESPVRQLWPFVGGVVIAALAIRVTGNVFWATGIVVVIYIGIYRLANKAAAHEQAMRKTLD